ncbi:cyclohexanone monooxygenase [Talaromyces proteolyticus]|uniref:Cyclohexanone monooxygenase n=1 Tax=Talaromyces proteolyticus TaxID=1131652 RepID=A0AAD4Q2I2_9EURO|nr:cyclohexanone monooxygenase [Talaromyces proteolyticus]KAH8703712.1 cyclohexanone monooxygenase [Talaromyces proteolyticus]
MSLETDDAHENDWYNQDFGEYRITEHPLYTKRQLRVICVGAGASGLQLAYKADRLLDNVVLQIYEKNSDIGGTWLENRYPGCTCDIPSHSYQFTWARNPNWSHYYSSSEEIWKYFKDVSRKYDLEKYIEFNTTVKTVTWNEDRGTWNVSVLHPDGSQSNDWCDILISACGNLNSWKYPNIPGLQLFKGKLMHSATWDKSYDLTGKKVAVVGGGSSAVQIIPSIQPKVKHLVAFLRSPVWITSGFASKYAGPGGSNFKYSSEQMKKFENDPEGYTQYCRDIEGELNRRFTLMQLSSEDQKQSRQEVSAQMTEQLGGDDRLAKKLIPEFALGCRRMTPGSGYLRSLTAKNVDVVCESVVRFTENGIVDESGVEHEVDVIICATGFDTSFTPHFNVIGRGGRDIKSQFGEFPVGYMGIMAKNFPNLFLMIGPNGPASHGSIIPVLEWYTRYIFAVIEKVQRENIKSFEPKEEAIKDLYNHTHELMKRLVWSSACRSWFKNGKVHGPVTAIYPGSRLHFFEVLKHVRWEDFELGYRTKNRFQFMGNGYTHTELQVNGDPVWYFDDDFTKV